jgi:hypothetical protein
MRVPNGECLRWALDSDTEALAWQLQTDTAFVVSTEDGTAVAFDARNGSGDLPFAPTQDHTQDHTQDFTYTVYTNLRLYIHIHNDYILDIHTFNCTYF